MRNSIAKHTDTDTATMERREAAAGGDGVGDE